ncbi:DUF4238 domain-containing protein [Achromobacter xylosoxidans]|uniref:DUF4238 domain-containing protein n=1 Tax=Alcaligenes xylosoxydans xylosoxydans TaxID=85698 RepID=UPI0038FD164E
MHSTPKLQGPKRQHYLPRMYQKGFATKGGVAVFDRHTGETRRQTVENTGIETHIYTFKDEQGRRRYEIEEMLSKVEAGLADAIPRFEAAKGYTDTDVQFLISFIAFAELRTPGAMADAKRVKASFVDIVAQVATESVERTMKPLAAMYRDKGEHRTHKELRAEAEQLVKFVRSGQYDIQVDPQSALMDNLRQWQAIVDSLIYRDLQIIRPTNLQSRYMTSDSPVVLESRFGHDRVGFGSDDALILFPLTATCLISLSGTKGRRGTGSSRPEQVDCMNEALARNADRYIISGDDDNLRSLVERLQLAKTKRAPKYVVGQVPTRDGALAFVQRTLPHRSSPVKMDQGDPARPSGPL